MLVLVLAFWLRFYAGSFVAVGRCWEHQMVESPQMEHHCVCVAGTSIGE